MLKYQAVAFAALIIITGAGAALAQSAPMPQNNPEAAANVRESEQYSAAAAQQSVVPQKTGTNRMWADH